MLDLVLKFTSCTDRILSMYCKKMSNVPVSYIVPIYNNKLMAIISQL